ncbi:hypothetical protein NDU88_002007 [Pleurodeles waltl]|uniref:Uncharacterized protein n=1 Tax=Pleurodeles waltl TaxID=8319 RepID=A0AAV7KTE7_PLEWA|nr:hypothetical protein NDU88_002007 [Pleurodeles waltl]
MSKARARKADFLHMVSGCAKVCSGVKTLLFCLGSILIIDRAGERLVYFNLTATGGVVVADNFVSREIGADNGTIVSVIDKELRETFNVDGLVRHRDMDVVDKKEEVVDNVVTVAHVVDNAAVYVFIVNGAKDDVNGGIPVIDLSADEM